MPYDPARLTDTRAWLAKAKMDLDAAAFELTAVPPFTADVVFHAQQAAEKSLKGYLAWHDVPFRKTHNLTEIGKQCVELEPALSTLLAQASGLTEYAWKFRYPGEPEEPALAEAEGALATARDVYEAIVARLREEIRS